MKLNKNIFIVMSMISHSIVVVSSLGHAPVCHSKQVGLEHKVQKRDNCKLCKTSQWIDEKDICDGCKLNFINKNPKILCNLLVKENLTVGGNQCIAGNLKVQGCVSGKAFLGKKGPRGARGKKGQQGDRGPTGDIGLTGDRGVTGDKGITGDKGLTGDQGATGQKGETGCPGPFGCPGPTGEKGAKGEKGETGDRGITGCPGPFGCPGPTGDKGPTGDAGRTITTSSALSHFAQGQSYTSGGVTFNYPAGLYAGTPQVQVTLRLLVPFNPTILYAPIVLLSDASGAEVVVMKSFGGVEAEANTDEVEVLLQAIG